MKKRNDNLFRFDPTDPFLPPLHERRWTFRSLCALGGLVLIVLTLLVILGNK